MPGGGKPLAATEGYGLVGGIGEYEGAWQMAYVRGTEGIIVSLAVTGGFAGAAPRVQTLAPRLT